MLRFPAMRAATAAFAVLVTGCAASSPALDAAAPTCEQIRAFASQLVAVGITFDYDPSHGPADLANSVGLVVRGVLTGQVTSAPPSAPDHDAYIGYEIAVTQVLAGDLPEADDVVVVSVPYNHHLLDADAYTDPAVPGVPVIVFANVRPDVPGGWGAHVPEGFLTGCPAQPPLGFVGQYGSWPELDSLDAVEAAVAHGKS